MISYKYQVNQKVTFEKDHFKYNLAYTGTVCQCSHVDGSIYYQVVYKYGEIAWIPERDIIKGEPLPEDQQLIHSIKDFN